MTICAVDGCSVSAYYNHSGKTCGQFCATHKLEGMINVKDKRCANQGCGQRPSFNILGGKPLYCGSHQTDGMVNVMTKFCEHSGCLITPVYNLPDKRGGRFCATHKEEDMINVVNKMCEHTGCTSAPSFNLVGLQPRFCSEHKTEGMIDNKHKKCLGAGCALTPSYAAIGEKIPKYCSTHKLEGMINVKHIKCKHTGCSTIPSYNFASETKALYCNAHKLEGMVDTVHSQCEFTDCQRRPAYNNSEIIKPRFCVMHKLDGMVDVLVPKCMSEWCIERCYSKNRDGYCVYCYVNLFPDKPAANNYRNKEKTIAEYVLEKFPNMTWNSDKRIQDGCSRRRPDLLLDLGYQLIIIEIDENQHARYDCSCENKRLMQLSQDVGHRPIVFIRFNPDQYNAQTGEKHKSCWSISNIGISFVNKNNKKEWNERLNNLKNQIDYWLINKTDKIVEVIQLYYDEC